MMNDISSDPHDCVVEIDIRADGQVVWINIDGITALRACRVKELIITDRRNPQSDPDDGIQVRGSDVSRSDLATALQERAATEPKAASPSCVICTYRDGSGPHAPGVYPVDHNFKAES